MIKNDRGSALVLALISLAMLMVLSTGLLTITNNEWRSSKLGIRDLEYKYLAESGIERALAELRRDMLWTPDLNEIYEVDGNRGYRFDQWDWDDGQKVFKIKSTAMVAGEPHTSIYVELKPKALPDAFNYAACAGNSFFARTAVSSGLLLDGTIHANQEIDWFVLLPSISGFKFKPTLSSTDSDNISFRWLFEDLVPLPYTEELRGPVIIPEVDWNYYRQAAKDFGRYYEKTKADLTIYGSDKLIFVDGDATIVGIELERCTLVATGHVYIGSVDLADFPFLGGGRLMILAGGDINLYTINLLSNTRGTYCAGQDINVPIPLGLSSIRGTLVAGRDVNFGIRGVDLPLSGVRLRYDPDVNNPPPHVYWTSTDPPQIIKWEEMKA